MYSCGLTCKVPLQGLTLWQPVKCHLKVCWEMLHLVRCWELCMRVPCALLRVGGNHQRKTGVVAATRARSGIVPSVVIHVHKWTSLFVGLVDERALFYFGWLDPLSTASRFVKCEKCNYLSVVIPENETKAGVKENKDERLTESRKPPPPPKKVCLVMGALPSDLYFFVF